MVVVSAAAYMWIDVQEQKKNATKHFVPIFNIFMQWILTLIKIYLYVFFSPLSHRWILWSHVILFSSFSIWISFFLSPTSHPLHVQVFRSFFFVCSTRQHINSIFISLYQSTSGSIFFIVVVVFHSPVETHLSIYIIFMSGDSNEWILGRFFLSPHLLYCDDAISFIA